MPYKYPPLIVETLTFFVCVCVVVFGGGGGGGCGGGGSFKLLCDN